MTPIELLFEREGLPVFGLDAALAASYGGDFGLARPGLYGNFVSPVDGVVAVQGDEESGHVVSGDDEPDRFIMGLLRASVDAVLIGAGPFRKGDGDLWHPETVFPAAAEPFAGLRRKLGLRPHPLLVVVTASGHMDVAQPALRDALIITTLQGETRLRGTLPADARIHAFDAHHMSGRSMVDFLYAQRLEVILAEGGPTLVGQLLEEDLIDELFLTTSPCLFGRRLGDERKSLVEGDDQGGHIEPLEILREVRLEKCLDAFKLILETALHALRPERLAHPLTDLCVRPVGAIEGFGEVHEKLGTVGGDTGTDAIEHINRNATWIGASSEHQRSHRAHQHGLENAFGAVTPDVADDLSATGRVADQGDVVDIECFNEFCEVVRVGVHIVPIRGLAGAAVAATIMGDAAITARRQEDHLALPGIGVERPAMAEKDSWSRSPILVIDFRPVFGFDRAHAGIPSHGVRVAGSGNHAEPSEAESS
jgi:riboflavin biosynthesis pyrimidine reductase